LLASRRIVRLFRNRLAKLGMAINQSISPSGSYRPQKHRLGYRLKCFGGRAEATADRENDFIVRYLDSYLY
jgi:hypothetical protein